MIIGTVYAALRKTVAEVAQLSVLELNMIMWRNAQGTLLACTEVAFKASLLRSEMSNTFCNVSSVPK